jgi:hypothetical protein
MAQILDDPPDEPSDHVDIVGDQYGGHGNLLVKDEISKDDPIGSMRIARER